MNVDTAKYKWLKTWEHSEYLSPDYYHKLLNGSFSIKKVLPLFSDLSYKELDIHNGVEAVIAYSKFKYLPKEDILDLRNNLIKYCGLDTYSMFVILNNIKREISYVKEA